MTTKKINLAPSDDLGVYIGGVLKAKFDSTGLASGIAAGSVDSAALATAVKPLGVGQTWQDVLGSRGIGVTYTNTTGRTIMASLSVTGSAGTTVAGLTIDGVVTYAAGVVSAGAPAGFALPIPPGATYVTVVNGGTLSLVTWNELR